VNQNIGLIPLTLFVTVFGFPGILRFFICMNWKECSARVINQADVSRPVGSWHGIGMDYCYEAEIKFSVNREQVEAKVYKAVPFKDELTIYYNPNSPGIICTHKGLGWRGAIFLIYIFLIFMYSYYPNFIVFEVLRTVGDVFSKLKENL